MIEAGAAQVAFNALTDEEKRTMIHAMKLLAMLSVAVIINDRERNATANLVAIRTLARLLGNVSTVNHPLADKLVVLCEAAQLDAKVMA